MSTSSCEILSRKSVVIWPSARFSWVWNIATCDWCWTWMLELALQPWVCAFTCSPMLATSVSWCMCSSSLAYPLVSHALPRLNVEHWTPPPSGFHPRLMDVLCHFNLTKLTPPTQTPNALTQPPLPKLQALTTQIWVTDGRPGRILSVVLNGAYSFIACCTYSNISLILVSWFPLISHTSTPYHPSSFLDSSTPCLLSVLCPLPISLSLLLPPFLHVFPFPLAQCCILSLQACQHPWWFIVISSCCIL